MKRPLPKRKYQTPPAEDMERRLRNQERRANGSLVGSITRELKTKKNDPLTYENVLKHSKSKSLAEKGGHWELNDNLKLYNTATAKQILINGVWRLGVEIGPIQGGRRWHSHPSSQGWWPSLEDLYALEENKPEIIITKYGTWILTRTNHDINCSSLNEYYEAFHKDLVNKTKQIYSHIAERNPEKFRKTFEETRKDIHNKYSVGFGNLGIRIAFFTCKQDIVSHLRNLS